MLDEAGSERLFLAEIYANIIIFLCVGGVYAKVLLN